MAFTVTFLGDGNGNYSYRAYPAGAGVDQDLIFEVYIDPGTDESNYTLKMKFPWSLRYRWNIGNPTVTLAPTDTDLPQLVTFRGYPERPGGLGDESALIAKILYTATLLTNDADPNDQGGDSAIITIVDTGFGDDPIDE